MRDAFDLCGEYEALLSKTKEGSDVYKINHAGGNPVECDPRTIEIIQDGLDFGALSGGSFNIGLGSVMELWDFHAVEPKVPAEEDIQMALEHVYDLGAVDETNPRSLQGI